MSYISFGELFDNGDLQIRKGNRIQGMRQQITIAFSQEQVNAIFEAKGIDKCFEKETTFSMKLEVFADKGIPSGHASRIHF